MTKKTETRARKTAALCMIELTEAERAQFEREIPEIMALCGSLGSEPEAEADFSGAKTADLLREDKPLNTAAPETLLALSKKERDGYLHVVRTLG